MCGIKVKPNTKTYVTPRPGERLAFCCPHCAIMQMSLPQAAIPATASVTLTDWATGDPLPSTEVYIVYESDLVPCCNPSVICFSDKVAVEAFMRDHGGELVDWKECRARTEGTKCDACGMATYAPDATRVVVGQEEQLACCPMCAVSLMARAPDQEVTVQAACDVCSKEIVVHSVGRQTSVSPDTTVVWQGLKDTPEGKKPTGCHFNHWFHGDECLDGWRKEHPDEDGRALSVGEALQVAMQKENVRR